MSVVSTLPADWYCRTDIFERERARIFHPAWWLIGPAESRQGFARTARAGPWQVVVTCDADGAVRGFHNVCRHRAGPLLDDSAAVSCRSLVCRYHGWRYGLDGVLKSAPGLTDGHDAAFTDLGLYSLRVETWNGLTFACADPDALDLAAWLGDIVAVAERFPGPAAMTFHSDIENDRRINWKTYADNGCEGYHVSVVHGRLSQSVDVRSIDVRGYPNGDFVGFDVTAADGARAFWVFKFPGLLLHFGETAFNAESVAPLGPARTALRRWFWTDGAPETDADAITAASAAVVGEDLEICEAVQRNLETGVYDAGIVIPGQEPGTAFFQDWVRRRLAVD
jgi:choline monooxygenase